MNDALHTLIQMALDEDCPTTDITIDCLLRQNSPITAQLISKEDGYFYGTSIVDAIIAIVDPSISVSSYIKDGQKVAPSDVLFIFEGPAFSLLKIERVLLNFLQRLSGITTTAKHYVDTLNNKDIQVLDTRKTTPATRFLEKKAVKAGGAFNHRHHLSDMVLIKENHLEQLANENGHLEERLRDYKTLHPEKKILIEIETLDQLKTYPFDHVDIIMFDNFSIPDVRAGIEILNKRQSRAHIEISGGITLDNIHAYSTLNIHRISVGALTHSVKALDLSLLFIKKTSTL
jgi:nicotinate-nucleotide pyrophosphorylase (carboxylating)